MRDRGAEEGADGERQDAEASRQGRPAQPDPQGAAPAARLGHQLDGHNRGDQANHRIEQQDRPALQPCSFSPVS